MFSPSLEEIYDIANTTALIFRALGIRTCLFGSAACSLFGVSRTPNDVDIIIFTKRYNQEELKELLVEADSRFFLVPSRSRSATYQVLWFRLPDISRGRTYYGGRTCKVDVLLPGLLNIPHVPPRRIRILPSTAPPSTSSSVGKSGTLWLPVMPLIPLLLLKLQGWCDHRAAEREDLLEKQYVDVEDIDELLEIAVERGQTLLQNDLAWVPATLLDAAVGHVQDYVHQFPDSARSWRCVGFGVG